MKLAASYDACHGCKEIFMLLVTRGEGPGQNEMFERIGAVNRWPALRMVFVVVAVVRMGSGWLTALL